MPPLKPMKRTDLIYHFKQFGYEGPYSGGKHQFMLKEKRSITIPNPHQSEIGKEFLKENLAPGRHQY